MKKQQHKEEKTKQNIFVLDILYWSVNFNFKIINPALNFCHLNFEESKRVTYTTLTIATPELFKVETDDRMHVKTNGVAQNYDRNNIHNNNNI